MKVRILLAFCNKQIHWIANKALHYSVGLDIGLSLESSMELWKKTGCGVITEVWPYGSSLWDVSYLFKNEDNNNCLEGFLLLCA